MILINNCFE